MNTIKYGFHAGIAGGLHQALLKAKEFECTAVRIFSRNPRGWTAKELSDEEVEKFQTVRAATGIAPVVIHANYLINLASSDADINRKSQAAFRDEVVRGVRLKADYLVVHPGSSKGAGEVKGIAACAASLRAALADVELHNLQILIENTAGQGDSIGHRFEHLRDIKSLCPSLEVGVCFDTAHAFAAGYDLRDAPAIDETLAKLNACVELKAVPVVHFNNSKTPFNSRVDRHANLDAGEIGVDAMRLIATDKRLRHAAFLLETPQDNDDKLRADIAVLSQVAQARNI